MKWTRPRSVEEQRRSCVFPFRCLKDEFSHSGVRVADAAGGGGFRHGL